MELIDHLWRDLDRFARAGARPVEILTDPGAWVAFTYRLGRAVRRLPRHTTPTLVPPSLSRGAAVPSGTLI